MPVKWDAEKDKFILNFLLLDESVNISTTVIDGLCTNWPSEFGDAPTRKAVQEHFFKIRKANKKFASGTTPATPTKPRATPVKKTNGTRTNGIKTNGKSKATPKRKRSGADDIASNGSDDDEMVFVPKAEVDGLEDGAAAAAAAVDESPTKRARTVVKYQDDDDEGAQMSGSDFQIDEI